MPAMPGWRSIKPEARASCSPGSSCPDTPASGCSTAAARQKSFGFAGSNCVARAGLVLAGGQLGAAEAAARELISAEPLRERGYRLLMEVLAARGEIAAALQVYEQLRVRLRDELGITPGAAIRAMHEKLLTGGEAADVTAAAAPSADALGDRGAGARALGGAAAA